MQNNRYLKYFRAKTIPIVAGGGGVVIQNKQMNRVIITTKKPNPVIRQAHVIQR